MSHEAHSHDTHATEKQHKAPLGQAFWFTLVLVCVFVAALNFVNVMSADEEGGHGGTHTEATHEGAGGHEATHEATHEAATEHHEEAAPAAEHGAAADTAHAEAAHH